MEFGKTDDLAAIDFTLPPDTALTSEILKTQTSFLGIHCGCAKWGRKEWVGKLYPKGVKEKDFLQHYVQAFNSIELNATYYRIHLPSVIEKWRDTAGDGFKFCPKFPQVISHVKRLKDAEQETDQFIHSIMHFEDKLGPAFLQLPPNFTPKSFAILQQYLKMLPEDLRVCVELRHPGWFEKETMESVFAMFADNKIGSVITDAAGRRDVLHMNLTTPLVFVRFVGNNLHPTDYSRMNDWVERLGYWMQQGVQEIYFFIHQHEELDSPKLASYFIQKMNTAFNMKIKEPRFIDPLYGQTRLF